MTKIRIQHPHQLICWVLLPAIFYSLNLVSFSNGQISYILPDEFPYYWQQGYEYMENEFVPSSNYPLSLSRADIEDELSMEPIPMEIPIEMNDLNSELRMVLVEDDFQYDNKGDMGRDDDDDDFDFDKEEDFDDDEDFEKDDEEDDDDDYPYGYGGYNKDFGKVKAKKGSRRKDWDYTNYSKYQYHKYAHHPLDKYTGSPVHSKKQSHTYHKYSEHPLEKYGWGSGEYPYSKLGSKLSHTFDYLKHKFAEKNAKYHHHHGHHNHAHHGWASSSYSHPEFSAGLEDTYGYLKHKFAVKNAFHHKHYAHNYGW